MSPIPLTELLINIGFKRRFDDPTDSQVFVFDFGSFQLEAVQSMNNSLADVWHFSGIHITTRECMLIEFELPLTVESFEQGVAYISDGLGKNFKAQNVPAWYHQGVLWKTLLPYEIEKLAYRQKPSALIEHDYFRLVVQKMRKKSVDADEDDITTLSFDGNTLTINCLGERIIAPATGRPWEEVTLKTKSLAHLPQRIKQQSGTIHVWNNSLYVANVPFLLLDKVSD